MTEGLGRRAGQHQKVIGVGARSEFSLWESVLLKILDWDIGRPGIRSWQGWSLAKTQTVFGRGGQKPEAGVPNAALLLCPPLRPYLPCYCHPPHPAMLFSLSSGAGHGSVVDHLLCMQKS